MSTSAVSFVCDKRSGINDLFVRFTDTSDITGLTSATDYIRTWSFLNIRTSALEYVISTSASIVHSFSGNLNDTFTVSLSATY